MKRKRKERRNVQKNLYKIELNKQQSLHNNFVEILDTRKMAEIFVGL